MGPALPPPPGGGNAAAVPLSLTVTPLTANLKAPVDDRLSLTTPERVTVELALAGIGHRVLAWSVDALIQFLAWIAVAFVVTNFLTRPIWEEFDALATLGQVLSTLGVFALNWGYHVVFEIVWDGRSPGKRVAGIRVVRPDGSPEGALEALIRNLARAVDMLPFGYIVGLVTMAITPTQRRLGDLLAGTILVKERGFDLSRYAPAAGTAASASSAASSTLTAAQYELVAGFLSRREALEPAARARVALQVARAVLATAPEQERAALGADPAAAERFLADAAAAYGRRAA